MAPPPIQPQRRPGRWRWVLVALLAIAGLTWWVGRAGEAELSTGPPLEERQVQAEPPTPISAPPVAVAAIVDAGARLEDLRPPPPAGPSEQQRIEETMRRWRQALAPLFRIDQRRAGQLARLISVAGEAPAPGPEPEAFPVCEDTVQTFSLRGIGALDLVIAIDTSGSMTGELMDVIRWLAELELLLRQKGVSFQMLVVADHRSLNERFAKLELDGGRIQLGIGSRDALETLIRAATEGYPRNWVQLLRPGSTRHLVIVTDDDANDRKGLPYLGPLTSAANGALGTAELPKFTLHVLGGFQTLLPHLPIAPEAPLAFDLCRGGVARGLAYQRLAQVTGGLRASLCDSQSARALSAALADAPLVTPASACVWLLRRESTVAEARALRAGLATPLTAAASVAACPRQTDAWLASGQIFALCDSTCARLIDAGFESLEVSTRCER